MYLVIYPPRFSSSDGRSSAESIFAIHSFLEGHTRFSSFDGNLVVSDQRQLGTYPLLSALVCSFVDAFTMLPPFPNVLPLVSPAHHSTQSWSSTDRLAHRRNIRWSDTDIHYLEEKAIWNRNIFWKFSRLMERGAFQAPEVGYGHEILFHSATRSVVNFCRIVFDWYQRYRYYYEYCSCLRGPIFLEFTERIFLIQVGI